jgi:glycosyltransferase involved in cell wall biosynthesis
MMRSTHRLGIYCPGNGAGGPWRYVYSLLAHLDPAEFAITLFCDLPVDNSLSSSITVVGLTSGDRGRSLGEQQRCTGARRALIRRALPGCGRLWAGFAREAGRLARLLRRHPVDLFHTQNAGCEESPAAARLAGIRHVVGTFHVGPAVDLRGERAGPRHRVLETVSNRCLRTAISVSDATRRDWVRRTHLPAERVVTIRNGIDPERFRRRHSKADACARLGLPTDALIVGGVGRLDEVKGFGDLIAAAASLRCEFPSLHIALAGNGPLRSELESTATRHGIGDRVRFLGFQNDVQPVLDAIDVFAMPSRTEALPYALLEAMAAGLPTVGAAVGGVPEVIASGETGFLVAPRDPVAFATSLRMLLRDSSLRDRMGAAGRERVTTQFHERDMVRRTANVYRQLIGTGRQEEQR